MAAIQLKPLSAKTDQHSRYHMRGGLFQKKVRYQKVIGHVTMRPLSTRCVRGNPPPGRFNLTEER